MYRAGLWVARLGILLLSVLVFMSCSGVRGLAFVVVWVPAVAITASGLVMLARAGIPFTRRGLSWEITDSNVRKLVYRDFLLRR